MSFLHFFIETKDLNDYLEENQSGIGSKPSAEKVSRLALRIENLVQSEKGKFSDFFSLKGECKIHCANLTGLLDVNVMNFLDRHCLYTSTTFFCSNVSRLKRNLSRPSSMVWICCKNCLQ